LLKRNSRQKTCPARAWLVVVAPASGREQDLELAHRFGAFPHVGPDPGHGLGGLGLLRNLGDRLETGSDRGEEDVPLLT